MHLVNTRARHAFAQSGGVRDLDIELAAGSDEEARLRR
jgi:hypothetical protein